MLHATPRSRKGQQTRERLLGAAIAEFKRGGMAAADTAAIASAAGVAHGTFFFHFPTKEHVLLELEQREEVRIAKLYTQFLKKPHTLEDGLRESMRLVIGLERRLGDVLFKDFLALHFSQTRPPASDTQEHPVISGVAREIELAQQQGEVAADVSPWNSAVFFLLGFYALLITTNDWPTRDALLDDFVVRTMRSLAP